VLILKLLQTIGRQSKSPFPSSLSLDDGSSNTYRNKHVQEPSETWNERDLPRQAHKAWPSSDTEELPQGRHALWFGRLLNVFRGHGKQSEAAVARERLPYEPGAQGCASPTPAGQYEPSGHGFASGLFVPLGQK